MENNPKSRIDYILLNENIYRKFGRLIIRKNPSTHSGYWYVAERNETERNQLKGPQRGHRNLKRKRCYFIFFRERNEY